MNFSGKLEIGRLAKTVDADFGDFRLLRAEVERDLLIPVIFIDILKQTELEDLPLPGAVVLQLPVGAGVNADRNGTVGIAVEQLQGVAVRLQQVWFFRQIFRERFLFAIRAEREKPRSGEHDRNVHFPVEFPGGFRRHGTGHGVTVASQHYDGRSLCQETDLRP